MTNKAIAVIGAGPCGLAACKTLADYGLDYECLEASNQVGGIWNIERGGGGYRSLHTNTSTGNMSFSDFPFAEGSDDYLDAAQMLEYFNRYADHFQLRNNIRFDSVVAHVHPLNGGDWQVDLASGESLQYSSLVVASGQYAAPRIPHHSIPGEFSGQYLHVSDYLDPADPIDLGSARVVVVGLGNSAAEIATELCNSSAGGAGTVALSARSGRWVLPKMVDGKPLDARSPHPADPVPLLFRTLRWGSGEWLLRRLMGKMFKKHFAELGGASGLGLPQPAIAPWEDRPTISLDFIPALLSGRIDVRPGIAHFDGSTVHFTDASTCEADVLLYATGYDLDFPYIDEAVLGCRASDLALYRGIAHPRLV